MGENQGHAAMLGNPVKLVQPIQLVQHEGRWEPYRPPLSQIVVDPLGSLAEFSPRLIKPTVMFEIMNPNLKSILCEFLPQFRRKPVVAFRNKVERGTKSCVHLELH